MTVPSDVPSNGPLPSSPGVPGGLRRRPPRRTLEAVAVAGIVYAVLAIAGLSLLSRQAPDLNATDDAMTEWYGDAGRQAKLILGLNLISISAIAFLWFVAVIRRRLGDREDRFFGTVFFGSSIAFVAVWLGGAAAAAAPAVALNLIGGGSVTTASASFAVGMGAALILVVAPRLQAVFVFTLSSLIIRSGFLPRWLAYVGLATGVTLLIIPLVTRPIGLLFPVWVFVVSVVILLAHPSAHDSQFNASNDGPDVV